MVGVYESRSIVDRLDFVGSAKVYNHKVFGLTPALGQGYIRQSYHDLGDRESTMAEQHAHVEISREGGVTVVRFADRKILEEIPIAEIGEQLTTLADSEDGIKLLLDFENVEHLSSAVLSMLINLNKRVSEQKGQLKLANIKPQIYEVFKITRLNELFDIRDSVTDAKKSF